MVATLKRWLYFPIASYFRFFAQIRLSRWQPRIIAVIGSSGKTTLLHLLESQIGQTAKYSHHANSSYGIPFDILGLKRKHTLKREWPLLFFLAPIKAFFPPPEQKLYVVEADCDRPYEGKFITSFIKPEITLWLNVSKTHSMNFDHLIKNNKFTSIETAIAHEFGYFAEHTSKLLIINSDSSPIKNQLSRTQAQVVNISQTSHLSSYQVSLKGTQFTVSGNTYKFTQLLPQETFYAIAMCQQVLNHLNTELNPKFPGFSLPPGRSSVFKGTKRTTIIDSTYNANLKSMAAILNMFYQINHPNKWVILGDMIEQGKSMPTEHQKLAKLINLQDLSHVVLMGPRISQHTYPYLKPNSHTQIVAFETPTQVLEYLKNNLKGGELLLFKGARFLEGVIENLLLDRTQKKYLSRREAYWENWRRKWGLVR